MKKIYALLAVVCLGLFVYSCKKPGCIDPNASNYDETAKEGNELCPCTYEGSLAFWFNKNTSDSIKAFTTYDSLKFFVEDYYIDSIGVIDFQEEEPDCGDKLVPTYTAGFGRSTYRWVRYKIFNELGGLVWTDIVRMEINECVKVQLK